MVQTSLGTLRTELPSFASCQIKALRLYSPSEISDIQSRQSIEQEII
jgi:hypothetical protein